jgi:hypothetical protein
MRFISRSALLALVALCAIGVVGAAAASAALPEFSPAGSVAKPVKFKGKSSFLEIKSGKYEAELSGEITGSQEVANVSMKLLNGRGAACKNEPKVLNTLHGTLGYINKAKTEVGLLLKASGPLLFSCVVEPFESEFYYSGSVIARISAVNKLASSLKLEYQQKSSTEEEWEKFEGEKCTEAQEEEVACPHRLYTSVERYNYGPATRTTLTGSLELNGFTYEGAATTIEVKG